jgi:hypothetical protein
MSENRGPDSLQARVCGMADDLGLYWHHQRNSIGSKPGWPDLVILGPCGGLFRELKSETGKLTIAQCMIGANLTRAGFDWSTWRPADLLNGTIARQLAAIAVIQEAS